MLKKTRFGFDKVSTYMNCPETAEFAMDGPQLKKTGKLLIKYFITLILRKIFTFISTFIPGKETEKCRKR